MAVLFADLVALHQFGRLNQRRSFAHIRAARPRGRLFSPILSLRLDELYRLAQNSVHLKSCSMRSQILFSGILLLTLLTGVGTHVNDSGHQFEGSVGIPIEKQAQFSPQTGPGFVERFE